MANLLDQASIILTPTAYDNGKVLCVKPSTAPYGDFDFSRNSSATRVNAQGLVEDVQILSGELVQNGDFSEEGSQLITNGDFATDTAWVKGTGTTISGGSANFVNADGISLYQSIGTQSGFVKVTFTVTDYTSGTLNVYSGGNQSVGSINVSANALATYTAYVDRNAGNVNIIFGSNDSFTGSIDNVSVKEVLQDWSVEDYGAVSASAVITPNTEGVKLEKTVSADWRSSFLVQPISYTNGSQYKVTFKLKNGNLPSGGSVFVRRAYDSSSQSIVNNLTLTNDWVEYTYYFVADSNSEDISFGEVNWQNAGVGEYFYIDDVSVIEVTDDTNLPRINYDGFSFDGSGAIIPNSGCGSWLFEPQSTNLIPYSEDYSQWINTRSSDLIGFTSPNGTSNATKLISDTTVSSSHIIKSTSFSISSGQKYTYSVFLKANQLDYARIVFTDTSVSKLLSVYFDLTSGTVGTTSSGSTATLDNANIENFGNGWFKCSVSGDLDTVTNAEARIYLAVADNDSNFDGDGTSGIYIWGAQVEQQSYATSYIPTEGTTVTRNQDVCTNGGSSALINSTEGVLYAEIAALADDGTKRYISLSDGSNSNDVRLYFDTNGYISVLSKVGGSTQVFLLSNAYTQTDFNKVAFKYKENDFAFWINGVEVGTDILGSVNAANTLNELAFFGNNLPFFGKTKALAVWKTALTDTELEELTTI